MSTRAASAVPSLLAVLLFSALLVVPSSRVVAQGQYTYFDDFSSDKARVDSYLHSSISDPPCPTFGFDSFLCFNPDSLGNRRLAFYYSFTLEPYAYIYYRFPLGSQNLDITDGVVGFEIPGEISPGGRIDYFHSYDGSTWVHADSITVPGTYEYVLSPAQPREWVYIRFRGGRMLLDDLSVTLNRTTTTQGSNWGSIKALFD